MSDHSHAAAAPPPGLCLRVDHLVGGFRVQVVNPAGVVVQSFQPLSDPAGVARLVREWCEGRNPRLRAGDAR